MKVMSFHQAHFMLPENFEGTVADAIQLLADYHRAAETGILEMQELQKPARTETFYAACRRILDEFIDVTRNGKRFAGMIGFWDIDRETQKTEQDDGH